MNSTNLKALNFSTRVVTVIWTWKLHGKSPREPQESSESHSQFGLLPCTVPLAATWRMVHITRLGTHSQLTTGSLRHSPAQWSTTKTPPNLSASTTMKVRHHSHTRAVSVSQCRCRTRKTTSTLMTGTSLGGDTKVTSETFKKSHYRRTISHKVSLDALDQESSKRMEVSWDSSRNTTLQKSGRSENSTGPRSTTLSLDGRNGQVPVITLQPAQTQTHSKSNSIAKTAQWTLQEESGPEQHSWHQQPPLPWLLCFISDKLSSNQILNA